MDDRRAFLSAVGACVATGVAGCADEEPSGERRPSGSESDPASGGDSETPSGPETAVEQWLTAIDENDLRRANERMHPESVGYPIEEQRDVPRIAEIDERPLGEGLRDVYDAESVSPEALIDEWKRDTGVDPDEHASVYVDFEGDGEIYYPTTRDSGAEWKVWGG